MRDFTKQYAIEEARNALACGLPQVGRMTRTEWQERLNSLLSNRRI